jgi:hypothetical protein
MVATPTSSRSHQRGGRTSTEHRAAQRIDKPPFMMLKRVTMAAATAFVTVNIWTGAPVFALWVGSEVVGQRTLSMAAVGVVVFVLAVLEFLLALALTWLNNVYDEFTGRPRVERRPPWMRSMRDVAEGHISQRVGITTLERIVMIDVYIGVITLLIWFIFFAGPAFVHS